MDNTQWIVIIHIKLQITKSYNKCKRKKYNEKKINFNKLQFKFSNDNIII